MDGGLTEQFLDAVYDRALKTGDWRPALTRLRDLSDSAEASFVCFDSRSMQSRLWETTGAVLSASACEEHRKHFVGLDPKMPILAEGGPGFVFNDVEHFDDRFVAADPFYRSCTLPLGLRHTLDLFADADCDGETYLAVMRSPAQGPYDPASAAQLRLASKHFVRALKAREDLVRAEAVARHTSAALDAFDFGIAVVDGAARLAFANAFAQAIFEAGTPLRVLRSQVRASAPDDFIGRALCDALAGRPANFRLRSREEWIVSAIALDRSSPLAPSAIANVMLVVRSASRTATPPVEAMRALYGLSCAEAEIALGIAAGKSLRTLAGERKVKLSTVRWQLLAVLRKLGVGRQADVVRVLAAFSPPGVYSRGS